MHMYLHMGNARLNACRHVTCPPSPFALPALSTSTMGARAPAAALLLLDPHLAQGFGVPEEPAPRPEMMSGLGGSKENPGGSE